MGNRAAPAYTGPPVTAPPRAPAGYYSRSGQPRRAPAYRPAPAVGAYRQPRARYATAPTYAAPAGKSYDLFSLYFLFLLQLSPGHQWLMLQLMQLQVFKTYFFSDVSLFFTVVASPTTFAAPTYIPPATYATAPTYAAPATTSLTCFPTPTAAPTYATSYAGCFL